jgi:hypothetical protein
MYRMTKNINEVKWIVDTMKRYNGYVDIKDIKYHVMKLQDIFPYLLGVIFSPS